MRIRRLLLAAALTTGGLVAAPASHAATDPIQPGDLINTSVGQCTVNFVYDGGGKTYMGTAAHCVSSIGQDVTLISGEVFGDVAKIGNADQTATDWALIEVRAAFLSRVSAAMKGHPTYPTGVLAVSEFLPGPLQQSGYGVGFSVTNVTQEQRIAVGTKYNASIHEATGAFIFGDSGGPIVDIRTGKAFGIVSRLCVGQVCEETGPSVLGVIQKAALQGLTVSLRTV